MAIKDDFFDSLSKGAKWDVGVSINRTNPLPLDQYSVFETEEALDNYIEGAFAYPGQVLAVAGESETVIYYLTQNADGTGLTKEEVGSMPAVDNKSIKIKIDETTGEEILTLVGLDSATTGASLIKLADGSVGWSSTTQEGITADLTGIKSDISGLNTTVYGVSDGTTSDTGLVSKVEALETKFSSMGSIFNYRGSITVGDNETINDKIDFIPVTGDVVLVNGKQEYVYAEGIWEPFGDPHGIEELTGIVATHTSNITDLQTRTTNLETAVGSEAEGDTAATGLYAYADSVATERATTAKSEAITAAANALKPVSEQVDTNTNKISTLETNFALKADKTYVDSQLTTKVDQTTYDNKINELNSAINSKASQEDVDDSLALKADKTDITNINTTIGTIQSDLTAQGGRISTLEAKTNTVEGLVNEHTSTLTTHTNKISALEVGLGAAGDTTTETAFGAAADAKNTATNAKTAADAAQAKANEAYNLADTADKAAKKAQEEVDALEKVVDTKVDQTVYDAKVEELSKGIQDNTTTIATKANKDYVDSELAKKVDQTTYDAKVEELGNTIALKASVEYVDNELAEKADKTATETAISEINAKIGTLGTVMNFVGELTTDEDGKITLDGKTPENGDVGFIGDFEYVYIDGEWVKFGDTSAESGRISALETVVGNLDNTGLIKKVADLETADTTINNTITSLQTDVNNQLTNVNISLTNLEDTKASKNELNAAVETINDTIADLDTAYKEADATEKSERETAITNLTTYINDSLAWGTF